MNPELRAAPLAGLYALTPDLLPSERLGQAVGEALAGGVRLVQLRRKQTPGAERLEEARMLVALCHRHGARLIVNDDARLAVASGADGVHLGRDDGDVGAARELLGPAAVIGVSCYDSLQRAREAVAGGADYVAFGAVFPSPTKPAAVRAPLAMLGEARRLGVAVAAIGGITLANAPGLTAAGADLLAVISDLFEAPDIASRARAYSRLFK